MEFQCTFADTKFIRQLCLNESPMLQTALKLCLQLGYSRIYFGRREILQKFDKDPNIYLVVIDAEPGLLGQTTEKDVFIHMSKNESKITFVTPNQDLEGLSDSIGVLSFDDLDRLRSPQSNSEWEYPLSKKTKNISMLYSAKEYTTGHTIRTFIYNKYRTSGLIDFFTAQKSEHKIKLANRRSSLLNYRYNLIIENTFDEYHVSDQLKDAFLGKCIPIYLGNLTKYKLRFIETWGIDLSGVVDISKIGLHNALNFLDKSYYDASLPCVQSNHFAIKNRLSSLGWDGSEMINTDMSWLGDKVIDLLIKSLKRKLSQL